MTNDKKDNLPNIAYIVLIPNGLKHFIYREIGELYNRRFKLAVFSTRFKRDCIYFPKRGLESYLSE